MKELTVGHFLKWVLRRSSQIQILINDWQTGHSSSFWFLFLLELWPVYSQSFIGFVRLHAFPDDTLASISPLILYSFVCWPVCTFQGMLQARRRHHFSLVPPSFSYLLLLICGWWDKTAKRWKVGVFLFLIYFLLHRTGRRPPLNGHFVSPVPENYKEKFQRYAFISLNWAVQ